MGWRPGWGSNGTYFINDRPCQKGGPVEIGEEPVGSAARSKHARVILVASDAAAGSVRRAYAFAQTGACLCLTIPADKDALGRALGRSSCAMAAVTDVGFADAIVKKLAVMDPEHYEQASQRLQIKARRAMERREEQARHEKNLRRGKKRTASPEPPQPVQEPPREAAKEKPGVRPVRAAGALLLRSSGLPVPGR